VEGTLVWKKFDSIISERGRKFVEKNQTGRAERQTGGPGQAIPREAQNRESPPAKRPTRVKGGKDIGR